MMNNTDFLKAIHLLNTGNYTYVLCLNECTFTGTEHGINTLLSWIKSGVNVKGFFAADIVVGQVSAYLYVLLGVQAVYSPIMNEAAIYTLARYGIYPCCDHLVSDSEHSEYSDIFIMDEAVNGIKDAQSALEAIERRITLINY